MAREFLDDVEFKGAVKVDAASTPGSVLYADSLGNIMQDNAHLFWDATNKRLGIGTTLPGFPLHVAGNGNQYLRVDSNDGNQAALSLNTTSGNWILYNPGDVDALRVYSNTLNADVLSMNASGRVGIGVAAPAGPLEVKVPAWTNHDHDYEHVIIGNGDHGGLMFGVNNTAGKSYIIPLIPGVQWNDLVIGPDSGGGVGRAIFGGSTALGQVTVYGGSGQKTAVFRANATTPGNVIEVQKSDGSIFFFVDSDGEVHGWQDVYAGRHVFAYGNVYVDADNSGDALVFGYPGNAILYSPGSGALRTNQSFTADNVSLIVNGGGHIDALGRLGAGYAAYSAGVYGDSYGLGRWWMQADGTMHWGPGSGAEDTNLYRYAAGIVRTDGDMMFGALRSAIGQGYGGLWDWNVTPSLTNYNFLTAGNVGILNGSSGAELRYQNAQRLLVDNNQVALANAPFRPGALAGGFQTACGMWAGSGAPSNANGNNGDYYFRDNGTTYNKQSGAWVVVNSAPPSFAAPAIVLGTAAAAGSAATVIRSDATIVAFDTTAPTSSAFGDAAAVGAAAVAAHRDHVHGREANPTAGKVAFSGAPDNSTATGNIDDLAITNTVWRWNGASAATLRGIAGGTEGRLVLIQNIGSQILTISNENAGEATAANRIAINPTSFLLSTSKSIWLAYDATSSRWRAVNP